jgi:hypothetical protein
MKSVKQVFSVERLSQMNEKKGLDFDFVIQRKENIWDVQRKSMLIHSILTDFPIPALYATKKSRAYSFIDGKQRLTCVLSYMEDGFPLEKQTSSIGETELAGKVFSELPVELQTKIKEHKFELYRIDEAMMEELEELFFRLNNGMPLKQIETTRAILGGKLLLYVEGIANTPFFKEKIALSKASRQRFADQELVLQILAMIHNRESGFSGREIQNFVKELRKVELQKDLITDIQNVCYYLNKAFPKKEKFLRKLHIPSIFILALENQENSHTISPKEFGKWCEVFFTNIPDAYFQASQSGSAKKENVQKRLAVMKQHHHAYFKEKLNAVKDVPATTTDSIAYVMQAIENPTKTMEEIEQSLETQAVETVEVATTSVLVEEVLPKMEVEKDKASTKRASASTKATNKKNVRTATAKAKDKQETTKKTEAPKEPKSRKKEVEELQQAEKTTSAS